MVRNVNEKDLYVINKYLSIFDVKPVDIDTLLHHPFTNYIVVENENETVGFLCYEKMYERYELDYIYVESKHRGNKIGKELMDFFINRVEKENGDNITLEVSIENKSAIALYEKYNFKIVTTRPNYYNGIDGYLMLRKK